MNPAPHERADGWFTHALFALVAVELTLREVYHRTSGEGLRQVATALAWALCTVGLIAAARAANCRDRSWPARLAWLCAFATALEVMLGVAWRHWVGSRWGAYATPALLLAGAAAIGFALSATPQRWPRWRNAITTGLAVYIASQPVLALALAPHLQWPPPAPAVPGSATLFLLLDEADASLAPALAAALRDAGLPVHERAVRSVGANTIQAVPAMFTQRDFSHPKPCGWAALCSGSNVLDFARIHASRDDVDVVGFYHPYCAMQGLRSCVRIGVQPVLLDAERWSCALSRRAGWPADLDAARCNAAYHRTWQHVQHESLEAFWAAPFGRRGGMMFAHLPLPHPPGPDVTRSLDRQYLDNAEIAVALLRRAVAELRAAKLQARVIVFSDHPLRYAQWCDPGAPFQRTGACASRERMQEHAVPMIVAGEGAPTLDAVYDNGAPFELAARWR